MNKKIKNKIRKIIHALIPARRRVMFYWHKEVLKLSLSSKYNTIRHRGEFEIAKSFNNYQQSGDYVKAKEALKHNLDAASLEELERFLKRQQYIFNHNILEQEKLFTTEELQEQKECSRDIGIFEKKMKNLEIKHPNPESIYALSGLKWLPQEIKENLRNGIFFDIGAYDGDSAIALAENFQASKVFAFEPEINNYERLKRNCDKYKTTSIETVKAALSDKNGEATLDRKGTRSKLSETGKEKVKLQSLDYFFAENKLENTDLIKIDVEGEEMKVLLGAQQTIASKKPVLAISLYHKAEDFFEIKPWLEKICPDYKFFIKKANPFSLCLETMLIAYKEKI